MLPLVDKPIIQYGVEEAVAAGIEQIIIVTSTHKGAIEDHFDLTSSSSTSSRRRARSRSFARSAGSAISRSSPTFGRRSSSASVTRS